MRHPLLPVLLALLVCTGLVPAAAAAEPAALADLAAAKALAARERKQLVVEFSGRTWCPPCQALLAEVLPSAEFQAFVQSRVFVHLDYPRRSERTPEKIAASPVLARLMAEKEAHRIEGFPTVLLLDADGRELGRVLGYEPGAGPAAFLAELTGRK